MARFPGMTALRAFESAARHMSIKQAADELNLSAGAVSRQILSLEEALGIQVFQRRHRKIELTPAGRLYLADISEPLAVLKHASELARSRARKPIVSIVAYPTFAVRWLMPRWGRFLSLHPDVDLRLTTSLSAIDFKAGEADFALRVADPREQEGHVDHWKIMEVDLYPVAAPRTAQGLRSPADLASATLLHSRPRPEDWPRWLNLAGLGEVDAKAGLRFESLNVAMQGAIEGMGIAMGVGFLVAEDLAAGRLVRPFDLVRRSERPMHLIQYGPDNPGSRVFRDWLLQEAATDGP